MKKTIARSTQLKAGKDEIFLRLQKLETLQHIAFPYAKFVLTGDNERLEWKEGSEFSFRFYLFGFIPLGIHEIHVLSFDKDSGISTEERNKLVPLWNHRIYLEVIDHKTTRYTDEVEIGAGWKTPFVALWAKMFYAHRQRKWQKLLSDSSGKDCA